MHNFRKNPRTVNRSMDGLLSGAPGRGQRDVWPERKMNSSNFRARSTSVDDFKRADGFHPTTRNQASLDSAPNKKAEESPKKPEKGSSLLHMTLPGGSLHRKNRKDRKAAKKLKYQGKWGKVRKWSFRSSLVFAGLVLILGGFLVFKGYLSLNKIFKGGGNAAALQDNVFPDLLRGEGDGRINVLLLGRGGEGHDGADLTDTILLASIDPVNKTAALVSVPRDLWVTTSGQSSKINAVFAYAKNRALRTDKDQTKANEAGLKAIREMVSKVLDVPIHYNVMVDFQAFEQAVNTVGGVTIDVPEDLVDYTMAWQNGGSPVLAKKGVQNFDGRTALMYVRSRHGSARGDFDRTERQRLFIAALTQKILSAGTYTNPIKVTQLIDTFGNHVLTDFSVSDAIRLLQIVKDIPMNTIASVGLADPPNVLVQTGTISGQSVVTPKAGVSDFSKIQSFVRTKLPDGYIVKENARVDVLNGTSASGLASTKADELKTYSYNIGTVGDAPTKTYTDTIIVDLTNNKPYTKNYLEKRFGVKAVSQLPDDTIQAEGADFVIILGSNSR